MAAFSLIASMLIGEPFAEPGGAAAIPLVLAWLAPLLALATLALFVPRWGFSRDVQVEHISDFWPEPELVPG
jgi:hypothetical protein